MPEDSDATDTVPRALSQGHGKPSLPFLKTNSPAWMKALALCGKYEPSGNATPECSEIMEPAKNDAFTLSCKELFYFVF